MERGKGRRARGKKKTTHVMSSFATAVLGALLKGRPDSQRAVWADFLPAPGRVVIVKEAGGVDAVDIGVLISLADGGDALHSFRVDATYVHAIFLDSPEENIQHMVRVLRACGHELFKVVPEPEALRLVSPDKIQLKLAPLAAIAVDATTAGYLVSAPHGRSTHVSPAATTTATTATTTTTTTLQSSASQRASQQMRGVSQSLSSSSPSQVLASPPELPTQGLVLPESTSDATAAADATQTASQGSPTKATHGKPLTRPPPKAVLKTAKRTRR